MGVCFKESLGIREAGSFQRAAIVVPVHTDGGKIPTLHHVLTACSPRPASI